MPIPKPKPNEKEQDFVGRCVSQLRNEDPDATQAQIVAICFDAFKTAQQGEKMETDVKNSKKEIKLDEDGHIIVAENVKVRFGANMMIQETVDTEE